MNSSLINLNQTGLNFSLFHWVKYPLRQSFSANAQEQVEKLFFGLMEVYHDSFVSKCNAALMLPFCMSHLNFLDVSAIVDAF